MLLLGNGEHDVRLLWAFLFHVSVEIYDGLVNCGSFVVLNLFLFFFLTVDGLSRSTPRTCACFVGKSLFCMLPEFLAVIIWHREKVKGDWGCKVAVCGLTRGPPVCWLERLYKAAQFIFFFWTADHVSVNRSELWSSRESAQLGNLYCDLIFAFTAGKARGAMSSKSQQ